MPAAAPSRWALVRGRGSLALAAAFALTVMADPVSSIAYAIEAALAGLDGDVASVTLTMSLVVLVIALVAAGYHRVIGRFPGGGGGAEAIAAAFGERFAFVAIGALVVDFTLTIAVSAAAAASAIVAAEPGLADARALVACGLVVLVGAASLVGHRARVWFGAATFAFIAFVLVVVARVLLGDVPGAPAGTDAPPVLGDARVGPALLAVPLAMALATGVESPSTAMAELGQVGPDGRRRVARVTLWTLVAVVGALSVLVAASAARLGDTGAGADSTLLADVARAALEPGAAFDAFQVVSALLLLAAAASAYLAGSGLLHALTRDLGLLPAPLGHVNRFHATPAGLATVGAVAVGLVIAAAGEEQVLVGFYAVSVFLSFAGALAAVAVLDHRDGRRASAAGGAAVTLVVGAILVANIRRLDGVVALAVSLALAALLHARWVRAGRPAGVGALG